MRVGIIALLHESNTFITRPTQLGHFQEDLLLTGEAIRERLADTHHEIGGFFAGLEQLGAEAVPLLATRAVPYGTVAEEAMQSLLDLLWTQLEQARPLDGLLVAPHGATVSERHPDADGYWLAELRQRVGSELPIIGTLDAHANLSPQMVQACHALVAYRSNPHLDQRARGEEAARLLVRMIRGEIRPTMAAALPPMAINIERQLTSEPHCRPLYELADRQLQNGAILSNSILLGFPYADVPEMGSAVIAVSDNDPAAAGDAALEMADYLWKNRSEFEGHLIDVEEAVQRAAGLEGPVCLLDMGDNVGGGSPADSTFLAHALRNAGIGPSFVCLYDPESVQHAVAAGEGQAVRMAVGAKTDDLHGCPVADEFVVERICDGKFEEPQPRHGGFTRCDQGQTAIVRRGQLTIMLTSRRMPPFSLRQLTSCGVDPKQFQVLVAKGVNAPVAAYQEVCTHLIRVNTAGVTTADMLQLSYKRRRRPLYPFERHAEWAGEIVCGM